MSNVYCSFTMKSDDVGATIEALLANQREAHATIQYLRDENTRLLRELHEERKKKTDQQPEEVQP